MNKTLLLLLGFALILLNFTYAPLNPTATPAAEDAVLRLFKQITYQPLPSQVRSQDLPGYITPSFVKKGWGRR